MKVFIINSNRAYDEMFTERGWELTDDISKANLIQFTGGEDVSPYLYDEPNHRTTQNSLARDKAEQFVFRVAKKKKIPMAGICRGGQFLNVMNGGKMYQHVDGHGGRHMTNLVGTPFELEVSSTHHQMMRPNYDTGVVLLRNKPRGTFKLDGWSKDFSDKEDWDIESVYYSDTNSLCFQPHPEHAGVEECRRIYFSFLKNYLGVTHATSLDRKANKASRKK